MVHIKFLELSQFKSFGETTRIPLLPGFTVVSGPNGSGKSNILDALLFALGLSSSKGMRADRLPDLVNHNKTQRGTAEANVSVTFDLADLSQADWTVTRRLRVNSQGSYTSNYYMNGQPCTLSELHEQLNQLRIYPEGYNVVLQGDVTSIISMNSKERREIIDELAGVANFDRKIIQTKETLESVKQKEDQCRIIEAELQRNLDRLSQDCLKAEKYQKLKTTVQQQEQLAAIITYRLDLVKSQQLQEQIAAAAQQTQQYQEQLEAIAANITSRTAALEQVSAQVKLLGEEELIALQTQLANQTAQQRQLTANCQEITQQLAQIATDQEQLQAEIALHQQQLSQLVAAQQEQENLLNYDLIPKQTASHQYWQQQRQLVQETAAAAAAWLDQQRELMQQITALQGRVEPAKAELQQLLDRQRYLAHQAQSLGEERSHLQGQLQINQTQIIQLEKTLAATTTTAQTLATQLTAIAQQLQLQQATQTRLQQEQREKQRLLDKLEATLQAQQETQGSYATKLILQAQLPGVCGLVANLGRVAPDHQLALSVAAGSRLANIVVEDDATAAAGIAILKQQRGGRATFLPLRKINPPVFDYSPLNLPGCLGYAINLVDFDPKYRRIFIYVLTNTLVFAELDQARAYLGQYRMVTLQGELLETSGAMTGGSGLPANSLKFGDTETQESQEMIGLRDRLSQIHQVLNLGDQAIAALADQQQNLSQQLIQAKTNRTAEQLQLDQLRQTQQTLQTNINKIDQQLCPQELAQTTTRITALQEQLPPQEAQLAHYQTQLAELQQSQAHGQWQQMQAILQAAEAEMADYDQQVRNAQQTLQAIVQQQQQVQLAQANADRALQNTQQQGETLRNQLQAKQTQNSQLSAQINQTQLAIAAQEERLGRVKQERDQLETQVRSLHLEHQQTTWQLEQLRELQSKRQEELTTLQQQLQSQQFPNTIDLPEIPPSQMQPSYLQQLQQEIRQGYKRLQAMEPVNMLALEEHQNTRERLQQLSDRLATLEAERTELLLRIENFTTLRFQAFQEAFDAINQNFQVIFAELSDGDGYLQLENPQDPFAAGLNLVAHPKGKPVQRLASMSGGEKSLTALSFIFALQRYRPSPFYAFDEVDMFLDGANVERLARMIKKQTENAQFIVVSLRRPMIESSERVIGVTQARGAYTQVLGIKLPENARVQTG